MYVGSVLDKRDLLWLPTGDSRMEQKEITYNPGILKLFDEIVLNACDHFIETREVTKIDIVVNREENYLSVLNNGPGIPITIHEKEGVYIPQLIFTQFLTSSNYDDTKVRLKSGLNGLGAKITSAFSSKFIIETQWGGQYYKQTYLNNLSKIKEPKIKKKRALDFTKITWWPDLERMGVKEITRGTFKVLERRAHDIAAYVPGVKISFNNKRLGIKSFKDYVHLFLTPRQRSEVVIQEIPRWRVAVCTSPNEAFECISFVNGVVTRVGGTHVDHITDQVIREIKTKLGKSVRGPVIREQLMVLLFAKIANPRFDSQAKERLTTPPSKFGSQFQFDPKSQRKIRKLGAINLMKSYLAFKEQSKLSEGDGKKKRKITDIPNLDDANRAGGRESQKCTLFLTEGLSAKTFAIAGFSKIGRDYNGVYPLKGKLLNVRGASISQIVKNEEIKSIKKILGLKTNEKFDTLEALRQSMRYGKVCLLCDQDLDGFHIRGLLINLFHYFWPDLVLAGDFITCLQTPLVKARQGKEKVSFYNLPDYEQWKGTTQNISKWKIKYYKGLGSSTSLEAKESFETFQEDLINYSCDPDSGPDFIELAFDKKRIQDRKEWIRARTGKNLVIPKKKKVSLSEFFDKEFIQFSIEDCVRSIPSAIDGLKPSQRKILFGVLKRGLTEDIKVDQIRGYIAEHTLYAHGDASLSDAIINMNQDFVGSNNINLLTGCGNFGTRIMGGKDASSSRYVSTKVSPVTRMIFHPDDDPLLEHHSEGDTTIEPRVYYPIIPMILVNGGSGIGTGYSSDTPSFSPTALIDILLNKLEGNHSMDSLLPWYRNFKGTIGCTPQGGWYSEGVIEKKNSTTMTITELPIGIWTQKYKEYLDQLVTLSKISSYNYYSTDTLVKIDIIAPRAVIQSWIQDPTRGYINLLRLRSGIKKNLTLFDEKEKLVHFKTIGAILKEWYKVRLGVYVRRREYLLKSLKGRVSLLESKIKFIREVIAGTLKVWTKTRAQVLEQIKTKGYPKHTEGGDTPWSYLLDLRIGTFTRDHVERLEKELSRHTTELKRLKKTSPEQMWTRDLALLREELIL